MDAFNEDNNNTTTTDGGSETTNIKKEEKVQNNSIELHTVNDGQTDNNFNVYTSDVSFITKVRLLLWKNFKIQMIRRPMSCACKVCMPTCIMMILGLMTLISVTYEVDKEYGYEFDYILSNTGDAAQYSQSSSNEAYVRNGEGFEQEYPWPDVSIANEWIKYIVCPGGEDSEYDKNPPSYLAIVAEDYENYENLQDLLTVLAGQYGNSTIYPQDWLESKYNDDTWSYPFGDEDDLDIDNLMNVSRECIISVYPEYGDDEEVAFVNYFPPTCPWNNDSCWITSRNTQYLNFAQGSLLKFFNSESELEDYIKDTKYGNAGFNFDNDADDATRPIGAAIIFEEIGGNDGLTFKYKLRFNSSYVPDTNEPIDIFTKDKESLYYTGLFYYLEVSGAPWLQTWLDEGIMKYIINKQYSGIDLTEKLQELRRKTNEYSKGIFQFPLFPYLEDSFWSIASGLFPFFLFIMFCYPIITVLSILVQEKQSKIKEGMKMMGATTSAYWTSWFIYFFIEFTLMALMVTAMGVGFNVFKYSSFCLIFLWFWLFCLSSATFSMMLSTIFDNPKTGSLFGLIAFFAALNIGFSSGDLGAGEKEGLCLLSPACFVTAVNTITQYESSTLGITWDNYTDEYNDFTFNTCLIMMFVDTLIYGFLTIYLDQVWPSAYGQKQAFYFLCLPSFWKKKFNCDKNVEEEEIKIRRMQSTVLDTDTYEMVNNKGDALIQIRELTKTFTTFGLTKSSRKEVHAVQGISLDMYRGEVFCLLGHNGAGKTTTISMMTGLLEITDGNALIMNNNISDPAAMGEIRKHLGVCPQHDVLWDRLSAKEHLWLFARLKGVPTHVVNEEVKKIAADTGLTRDGNDDKFPPQMSGGQRRKLSLGIALIGGSQIVFLDEPTSGMDPQSRRAIWDLISQEKKNRCMVLTTHFMDEADILGDRIAIMGGGKVKCCGSSLYLKEQYGVGYTFTVSLQVNDETSKNIDNIKNQIDKIVFDIIPSAQQVALAGSELTYRLPFEETGKFSKIFDNLDENKDRLSVKSYGISVTTLEEVFLKIGHDEIDDEADYGKEEQEEEKGGCGDDDKIRMDERAKKDAQNQFKQPTVSTFALQDQNAFQIFFIHVYAVLYKRFWWSIRDFRALFFSLFCPVILSVMILALSSTSSIATNEPEIELSTAPGFYDDAGSVKIYVTNDTSRTDSNFTSISNNFYMANNSLYYTYDTFLANDFGGMIYENIDVNVAKYFNSTTKSAKYPFYDGISYEFQDFLLDSAAGGDPYYNAFLFFPYSMTTNNQKRVYFGLNGSALHAFPITLNLWNNWIINDIIDDLDADSVVKIKASMQPLPMTEREQFTDSQYSAFAIALFLVIAFSFIPSAAIYFIVNEKASLTKHQQLVSGVSINAYWISNFIGDICIGLLASILVFIAVFIFDVDGFTGDAAGPFFGTLVLFLFGCLPFTYLLSYLFSSPDKAQLATILIYVVFGLILGLVSFFLDLYKSTQDVNGDLKNVYRCFPVFVMCESLFNISFETSNYNDWDICGRNYVILLVEGIGYFTLVLLLEYLSTFPVLLSKLGFVTNRPLTETDNDLDIDVLEEKKRIMKGIKTDENGNVSIDKSQVEDAVVIAGLRKVYTPSGDTRCGPISDQDKIEAVKNLYFGVKQSEVFGYLGVNGAGKSTTLATLTGERYPSSGTAFIAGFPISKQLQCRRYVGYCPQFDAIFPLLTSAEHLKFYAMIKGLKGDEADEQVKVLLNALTLNKYRNRTAGTYSGGNKRKLSVAMAMIGNPPVIFLDEPSTGMDPVSRRHMWEFISTTMAGRCVILTTHSMEECEALCNRVGIMVAGQLKCIGTAQHLKSRYGKGYQLDITLTQSLTNMDDEKQKESRIESMQNELAKQFGQITLIEHNGSRISYELVKDENTMKLGAMFDILEDMKVNSCKETIQAYALSQTTLEQIFIRMAKGAQESK